MHCKTQTSLYNSQMRINQNLSQKHNNKSSASTQKKQPQYKSQFSIQKACKTMKQFNIFHLAEKSLSNTLREHFNKSISYSEQHKNRSNDKIKHKLSQKQQYKQKIKLQSQNNQLKKTPDFKASPLSHSPTFSPSLNQYAQKKIVEKSPKDRLQKINHLINTAADKHHQMKIKIEQIKNAKKKEEELVIKQLTFSPRLSKSPRYQINGTFQERQRAMLQTKYVKIGLMQSQKYEEQIKDCTFKPSFQSKKKSTQILKNKFKVVQFEKDNTPLDIFEEINQRQMFISTKKPKIASFNYDIMKDLVRYELKRIKQ